VIEGDVEEIEWGAARRLVERAAKGRTISRTGSRTSEQQPG